MELKNIELRSIIFHEKRDPRKSYPAVLGGICCTGKGVGKVLKVIHNILNGSLNWNVLYCNQSVNQ